MFTVTITATHPDVLELGYTDHTYRELDAETFASRDEAEAWGAEQLGYLVELEAEAWAENDRQREDILGDEPPVGIFQRAQFPPAPWDLAVEVTED